MSEKISVLARNATLRQLQVFECIARHHSFSKAAEELFLTQPTVSMQVKKLVDVLEAPLFEQIGRKVYLTEAGEILNIAASEILSQLSTAEQKINHIKGFSGGRVKMSVISTAQYFVPKVIHDFTQSYPDVSVILQVGNKKTLLERIAKNADDFYLLGQPPEGLNVESIQLAVNPLAFVANSDHPLVGKKLKIEELGNEAFLMREEGSGIRAQLETFFDNIDFEPRIEMVLGGNEVIRLGLLQNLGITVTAVSTLMKEINAGEISILNVEGFPINRHWYLAYPKGKILSIAAEELIKLLKQEGEAFGKEVLTRFKQGG
ncbi:MAG: LysR family transcriptional regulator, low CO2-responsive transcriptional regulator [Thiomicrorhabdus sp.]|nr:MAG: LysR family transcriptional regulator, low CO2-responsive transcriptional regulator [Thiomicrorhabdus sp.]